MTRAVRVEAVITAQDKMRPGLVSAAKALKRFEQQQSRMMRLADSGAARSLQKYENFAKRTAGLAAGYFGAGKMTESVKRFADVDRQFSRIGITGDASVEQTRKGSLELRNLARDTALPFDDIRGGMDAITASGREFSDAMKMMPSVARTAQASGAKVDDIANSSTSMIDHMKISIEGLQLAQDTLAKGGQLGKFELKDMARYLPSMLPAFKAIGYEGQEGLQKLVAILQVIRGGTGTAEEAASSANNIFAKMESETTVKNFKDMGVNLPKGLAKARKEGKDLLSVFTDLTNQATKGDFSKLPQLFNDMEFARGMRAMLAGQEKYKTIQSQLKNSAGTINENFNRIVSDSQASIDRLSESADRAKTSIGALIAEGASPAVERGAKTLNDFALAMERATDTTRKDGFGSAFSEFFKNGIDGVKQDIAEVAAILAESSSSSDDRSTLEAIQKRVKTPYSSYGANMPKNSAAGRLLTPSMPANGVSIRELAAFSRDQLRRQQSGALPSPASEPWVQNAIDADREGRVQSAFNAQHKKRWETPSKSKTVAAPQPPVRPSDLNEGSVTIPVVGLDDAKTKLTEVKTSVDALGPAGQTAGRNLATGFSSGLSQMEADATAAIARIQQKLNTLKAPSLSFSGLNTGRATAGD